VIRIVILVASADERCVHILGSSMAKKAMLAGLDMAEHVIAHDELSSTFSDDIVENWMLEIEAWEKDSTAPNPFEEKVEGMT